VTQHARRRGRGERALEEKAEVIESLLGFLGKPLEWVLNRIGAGRIATLEHDRALFKKADAAVGERFVGDLLNSNLYNHWCRLKDAQRLGHFVDDFKEEQNQFLDRGVRKAIRDAIDKLDAVDDFVRHHFFASRTANRVDVLRLYPELRDSGEPAKENLYRQRSAELNVLLGNAWESYKKFRSTVKRRLKV
jgi:hypothetical protein